MVSTQLPEQSPRQPVKLASTAGELVTEPRMDPTGVLVML
jgi:hypothetical protein